MRHSQVTTSAILSLVVSLCMAGCESALAATEAGQAVAPARDLLPAQSRLGINLNGPADWNTEYPFVDVFRLSRQWISQRQGAAWGQGPKLEYDAHGWIKRFEPDCWAETPILTGGHAPSGDYVCLYEGEGQIEFRSSDRIVSHEPGRIVVHLEGQQGGTFLILRKTNPQNYVRNIRVIMPGFAATYQQEPFQPTFVKRWRGFDTFRFMDWMLTNGSPQKDWSDRPRPEDCNWTERGIPVEVMVDLCNRLKVNPWFCLPHQATDDYVRKFAETVQRSLDPSLQACLEYSNEVWNSGFVQNRYAQEQAKRLGIGPPERPWEGGGKYYAQRSVEIFKIWEQVFGGRQRLVRVIAWQAGGGAYWSDGIVLSHQETYKHTDALAIAPYITMCIGPSSKPNADTVAGWSLDQVLDYAESQALPECVAWMKTHKQVADKRGLRLLAYEAGQHLVGVGGGENNEALTKLFQAANRHPRMGTIYTQYLNAWRDMGGDLMCIFASTGAWSKWGSWGLAEFMDETENYQPKLKAVMEWNRRNPR